MSKKTALTKLKFQYRPSIVLNEEQLEAKKLILEKDITVITGVAGTGKSLVACEVALQQIQAHPEKYFKILLTRPYITIEDYGLLPGTLAEKLEPNYVAIKMLLNDIAGREKIDALFEDDIISILPVGFSRGLTIKNAIIIFDECQNFTEMQMLTLLTRLGNNSKIIITLDADQVDIKGKNCVSFLKSLGVLEEVGYIDLKINNRHPIIAKILDIFKNRS